jgi:hypothetical protein
MPKKAQKANEADFKVGFFQEYFGIKRFTYRQEIDRIDFIITDNADRHLIWAETKKNHADITEMFVQLILTIGKARTFDRYNPPPFLAVFDYEKIAFLQYNAVHDIFYQNDFNWNITPSDYKSKEFKQIKDIVQETVKEKNMLFFFDRDKQVLKEFIKNNFASGTEMSPELTAHLQIDKNNFITTYNRWVEMVKPSININWDMAKKRGIIDGDFYLADLLSQDNVTIKDKLYVILKKTNYELDRQLDEMGMFTSKSVFFKDEGRSHWHFWQIYKRPPKEEYWDYIIDRRDLLVPQDIRERKGSFFTPQLWVQKSQEYLTKVFGENWQEEYYVWDCAAGTGNLLVGLTNKYNLWASTLDRQDVDVMRDRINNGANLLADHVFQFDFLNDSFDKLPERLKDIINDSEKRKKLVIYINPPYAEVATTRQRHGTGQSKNSIEQSKVHDKYGIYMGIAKKEIFAQFLTRIYFEIPDCKIGEFSTLVSLSGPNFAYFRQFYKSRLEKSFIVLANTFDNVSGVFPIGFKIWNTEENVLFENAKLDIYDKESKFIGIKTIYSYDNREFINNWLISKRFKNISENDKIGFLGCYGNDFQNQSICRIHRTREEFGTPRGNIITKQNIADILLYFTVRHVFDHTWLNHNDQFLKPNENYSLDDEFINNCFIFALFHVKNNIKSKYGINHWIPYTEKEVSSRNNFQSDFMSDFLKGKTFSPEAREVLNSGRELWKYYHSIIKNDQDATVDASFYDIREYFQGRSATGAMKQKSLDETYNALIKDLRQKLSVLAEKIKPKVYEYGFLLE